jgi:hypothetical protein
MRHSLQRAWDGLGSMRAWAGLGVAALLGLAATSGEAAFVNLQHRDVDNKNNRGSLIKISGFKVR